ncbi:PREDICTED: RING-H2 finger protein ATL39-like [Prunus mume]|uniref:RING-type E3 ubiquitin transferase n=1 Tax=Prunus mume TaxID=102107 RepID=A0ABM0NWQ8_PRUMU|nr:PREDICTED: RING-H2 finger protein ATL39-like [Prunus mume]
MSEKFAGDAVRIVAMAIFFSVILLFVGIGFLILVHVWIVGRAFRRGGFGNGSMVAMASSTGGTASMSKDDLEKLPSFDYVANWDKPSSPLDCAVCLDSFKMGEKCRLLPLCKHSFHAQCVDAWLLQTPICPICRSRTAEPGKEGPVTDASVDLRESQTTGSRHLSDIRIELGENQTTESGHLSVT